MRSKQVIALRRYGSSPGSAIRETTFDTLERLFLNDPDLAFSNAAIGMLALDVMGIAFLPRVEDYVEAP